MAIRVQRHANVSKQATLLDGLDVCPIKWRICGCGLNRFVYGGMDDISNVTAHLKTSSENVNIFDMLIAYGVWRLQQIQISIMTQGHIYFFFKSGLWPSLFL